MLRLNHLGKWCIKKIGIFEKIRLQIFSSLYKYWNARPLLFSHQDILLYFFFPLFLCIVSLTIMWPSGRHGWHPLFVYITNGSYLIQTFTTIFIILWLKVSYWWWNLFLFWRFSMPSSHILMFVSWNIIDWGGLTVGDWCKNSQNFRKCEKSTSD